MECWKKKVIGTRHFCLVSRVWKYLFHMTASSHPKKRVSRYIWPQKPWRLLQGLSPPLSLLFYLEALLAWVAFSCSRTVPPFLLLWEMSPSTQGKPDTGWGPAAPPERSASFLGASVIAVVLLSLAHPWQSCEATEPSPLSWQQPRRWAVDRHLSFIICQGRGDS